MTAKIQATLENLGFSVKSHLTKDDFNGRKGQSHWAVTISRKLTNGHGKIVSDDSYTTEYHAGCAHRHYRNGKPLVLPMFGFDRVTVSMMEGYRRTKPNVPTLTAVMSALVADADVANYGCFEDWADCMGYDRDSREAEKMYRACCDSWMQLRRFCDFDQLSELFQDY